MGLFDVGSLRSKKLSNLSKADALPFRDGSSGTSLAFYSDARNGVSTRSLSANQASASADVAATLQAKRTVSGMTSRDAARQTKLERMMGAGVPQVQVVGRQDRRTPSGLVEQTPASVDSYHYRNQLHSSSQHTPGISRTKSVSEMSQAHSSYSRTFSSDLSNTIGGATTFTEMAEVDCPVCLEPLSHRLAGEKPHVVPTCGHALHNACFTAIYGPPEALLATQNPGSRLRAAGSASRPSVGPPGMCGVCRKPIALGEGNTTKSHKLAGIKTLTSDLPKLRSNLPFTNDDNENPHAHNDDPIEPQQSIKGRHPNSSAVSVSSTSSNSHTLPTVRARPEFPTIYCKPDGKQNAKLNVVSVLSIEVPSRRSPSETRDHALDTISDEYAEDNSATGAREDDDSYSDDLKRSGAGWENKNTDGSASIDRSRSPMPEARVGFTEQGDTQNVMARSATPEEQGFSYGATPAGLPAPDPTRAILDDLQQRVADWKGHSIEHFGPLVLHDLLNIRQDSVVREFHVYLFQEALLCVTEERRKGLGRFISNGAANGSGATDVEAGKPALKLKGRIYLRHIRRVLDSSVAGEHSLSITMDDENLDQFVLCFRETGTMDVWRSRLKELTDWVGTSPAVPAAAETPTTPPAFSSGAQGGPVVQTSSDSLEQQKLSATPGDLAVASGLSPYRPSASQHVTSGSASVLSGKSGSQQGTVVQARNSRRLSNVSSSHHSNQGSGSAAARRISASSDTVPSYQQWSTSGGLDPRVPPPSMLPHTPMDVVLMISVPSVLPEHISGSISSSAALKLRLIRSSLDFVIHSLGPNDRISLVAFIVGIDGEVKRTGLLNPHREASRLLLEEFVQNIGRPWDSQDSDRFTVDLSKLGGSSERIDSVTAVNVGLDVVLGRKSKNPITGMMLVNDTSDGPKRNQMDLVMARAEAANVAIHCFGYGKTHDPSSLWLISNHTRGSYTFVREWYQLRECIAGCLGSMMSVALSDVKVHIGVPQDNCFRIRKIAGLPGAIISSSGKDVDIDVGEIKFGEAKDLLVELELDLASLLPTLLENRRDSKSIGPGPIEQGSATDDFMQRMGIQDLSLVDSDGADGFFEQMVEEIGVFEADVSFKDPATGIITSRLPNPGILTLEIDTHTTDPLTNGPPGLAAIVAEPTVTRRRLEVLVSEMITRSLLLISRKNYGQALKVITETRRIIDTVVQALNGPNQSKRKSLVLHRSNQRRVREAANQRTVASLMAMMGDLDVLSEGLENQHRSSFDRDGRNFGAQQAMILRDQKAWTTRTDTEYLNFRDDNAAAFTAWSASFASMR